MKEGKPAPAFGAWAPPESPIAIEYSLDAMEQIRAWATDGLRQLSRGGIETGGVLFGERGEASIRITGWRPIECEHARGPAFLLTQNDRLALGQLLQDAKKQADLTGTHALGWFVSHTRSGLALTEADLRIYDHYFPWSWQTTLVLHPQRDGSAEAGFFARGADGKLQTEASYQPFRIEPMVRSRLSDPSVTHKIEPPPPPRRVRWEQAPASPSQAAPPPPVHERTAASSPAPSPKAAARMAFRNRNIWMWVAPALLAIIVLAEIVDRNGTPGAQPSFGLRVGDNGGELRLEWDKRADVIRDAVRGSLDIKDGPSNVPIPLDAEHLREGTFNYTRKTGDLEVRMTVYPVNGAPVQENARFVGPPVTAPSKSGGAAELRRERDALASEAGRLREELRKERARNKELEQAMRILENRVQVEKHSSPRAQPDK